MTEVKRVWLICNLCGRKSYENEHPTTEFEGWLRRFPVGGEQPNEYADTIVKAKEVDLCPVCLKTLKEWAAARVLERE